MKASVFILLGLSAIGLAKPLDERSPVLELFKRYDCKSKREAAPGICQRAAEEIVARSVCDFYWDAKRDLTAAELETRAVACPPTKQKRANCGAIWDAKRKRDASPEELMARCGPKAEVVKRANCGAIWAIKREASPEELAAREIACPPVVA